MTQRTVFGLLAGAAALCLGLLSTASTASTPASETLNDFWLDTYGVDKANVTFGLPGTRIPPNALVDQPKYPWSLLAKAQPDECYDGIGAPYPPMNPDGSCPAGEGNPDREAQAKVNQAYVFGMADTEDYIWFGTAANMACMVFGGDFLGAAGIPQIPFETPALTCEFGAGQHFNADTSWPPVTGGGTWPSSLDGFGDHRQPQIYRYHKLDGSLEDMSPSTGNAASLLVNTYGLRAAGTLDDVVLLAGPEVGNQAVIIFAYNRQTGQLIDAQRFPKWGNVRSMEVAQGSLYIAMQNVSSDPAGSVVKWTGSKSDPLQFVTVGTIPENAAAFMAAHDDHLYVSTWFGLGGSLGPGLPHPNGIWKIDTPLSAHGGLPPSNASLTEVFNFAQYENDPVVAASYFGGALHSYKGKLYFGTINFPGASLFSALLADQNGARDLDCDNSGVLELDELLITALGTFRPATLFRGDDLGTPGQSVELLYGSPYWPSYIEGSDVGCAEGKGRYAILPLEDHENLLGEYPQFGLPGINNFFNAYIWSMEVFKGDLFVGSFDNSSILSNVVDLFPQAMGVLPQGQSIVGQISFPPIWPGADLFRFDDPDYPAVGETISGFTNISNYGVRSMVASENLYVGTANPMNLNVDTGGNDGGWELIRIGNFLVLDPIDVPGPTGLALLLLALLVMTAGIYAFRKRRTHR